MKKTFLQYRTVWLSLLLAVLIIWIYEPVRSYEFIDYDDNIYVFDNPLIQKGFSVKTIIWAFGDVRIGHWHPLTWLTHMLDWQLFGKNAGGHHWTNVIFHIFNSILLFMIMRRMTGEDYKSFFVAALFAVHPLNVESVAWVAERKNLLSMFMGLLTILAYIHYLDKTTLVRYLIIILCFTVGLLSKPILVTLPFVLLLLDFWPLNRMRNIDLQVALPMKAIQPQTLCYLLKEKTPLFILSLCSMIITIYAAHQGSALRDFSGFPWDVRVANAFVSYVVYINKLFWPSGLAVFYPYREIMPFWHIMLAIIAILFMTLFVIWTAKRYPYLAVGWLWYLVTNVPTIGIIQVGFQSMADRYVYIPAIGLFIMLAWGVPDLFRRSGWPKHVYVLPACAIVITVAFIASLQVQYWQNSLRLFSHAIAVTKDNTVALHGLGNVFLGRNDLERAKICYIDSIRARPENADVRISLGTVYLREGKPEMAAKEFAKIINLQPNRTTAEKAHNNLGVVLANQGRLEEAVVQFQMALKSNPDYDMAKNNLFLAMEDIARLKQMKDMSKRKIKEP